MFKRPVNHVWKRSCLNPLWLASALTRDSYPNARVSRRGCWDMIDACSLQRHLRWTAGPSFCSDYGWVTPFYINSFISEAKGLGAKLISIKTQTSISSIMESTGVPRAQMGFLLEGRENTHASPHPAAFPESIPNKMTRYFILKLKTLRKLHFEINVWN